MSGAGSGFGIGRIVFQLRGEGGDLATQRGQPVSVQLASLVRRDDRLDFAIEHELIIGSPFSSPDLRSPVTHAIKRCDLS